MRNLRGSGYAIRIQYKDLFYLILRWPARLASTYRYFSSNWIQSYQPLRIHLGCGPQYMNGWVNVDIVPYYKKDLWLDIRDPWPLSDSVADVIYSNHVFEHFDEDDLSNLLRQSYRVLKPGGVLRFGVPSLTHAINAYITDQWDDLPISANARSKGHKLNDAILYHSQHKLMLDYDYAKELLENAGFTDIQECQARKSEKLSSEDLKQSETEYFSRFTLYVEAVKT
jgi:predicted SAM-dependent methyltransferase